MWPVLVGQAIRWTAVTAVSWFGYDTVKTVTEAATRPATPEQAEEKRKQSRFLRVAVMAALGLVTLHYVDKMRRRRRVR